MDKKGFTIILILLWAGFAIETRIQPIKAQPNTWTVDDDNGSADFTRIQSAINAASEGDIIRVYAGIYYEHIVVNRSISLFGENKSTTILDGKGAGSVVLVIASNVDIRGFTVRNGQSGIYVIDSNNCSVGGNLVHHNQYGVRVSRSQNCTVKGNYVFNSSGYGININASRNVLVHMNGASDNYFDGIGLFYSNNTVVSENTVNGTHYWGIIIDYPSNHNVVYHNNVFNNGLQARSSNPTNSWDADGEGNYWGDYDGADEDGNGIGDEPYIIDKDLQQQDNSPLIHPYVNEAFVNIDSESPIASFTFSPEESLANEAITFDASSSYDSVGKNAVARYEWNFGDGTTETGALANHTYLAPGNYTVVLTVVDMAGNEGHASSEVQVQLKRGENGMPYAPLVVGASIAVVLAFGGIAYALRRKRQ